MLIIDDDIEYNIAIPNNDNLKYFFEISEENYNFYYYFINSLGFPSVIGIYYLYCHNLFKEQEIRYLIGLII